MKGKLLFTLLAVSIFCTACRDSGGDSEIPTLCIQEIQSALEKTSYENMDILFDEIDNYNGQELVEAHVDLYDIKKDGGLTNLQLLDLYVEEVIPSLLDAEEIDTSLLYDYWSGVYDEALNCTYNVGYAQIVERIDEYDALPDLLYDDVVGNKCLFDISNWNAVNISLGRLGSIAEVNGPFEAKRQVAIEKWYDCRVDDLSDSYLLMDGAKTVEEAKAEVEKYLNEHYPIAGRDNGIYHEVRTIGVGKITGTDYYAFLGTYTHSYNGIPFREEDGSEDWKTEDLTQGECILCETGKVDVTIGVTNCYKEPESKRVITEHISFAEVLKRVSVYLTGETKFQLIEGCVEYRLFEVHKDGKPSGNRMKPCWSFVARDPNDDSLIKIFVDVETGEAEYLESCDAIPVVPHEGSE